MSVRAHVAASLDDRVGTIDRRLFGGFVEHLGRSVYGGIHEPGHPTADDRGFRSDVLDLVTELGVTTVRYPGGNFVSGYRWEDGVGPPDARPRRLDLAWHSVETNQVGLDEFIAWCRAAAVEPMLAVNLGTRGVEEALALLEYANHPAGTTRSDERVAHGSVAPHDVRMWCLGNEMDGPWQLGHMSAEHYGDLAARTAAAMHMYDPGLELVVCGSSHSAMPTFGAWERTVLERCFEHVDLISCHAYYQQHGDDLASFLASAADMDEVIASVCATADDVGRRLGSSKRVDISFDEWNVWYLDGEPSQVPTDWPHAPRLLEDTYHVADAVVVGSLLMCLLRHCDRVRAASLAQLVNVIAPIRTEPGGPAWRQTTFHPFAVTSRLACGETLRTRVECPATDTARHGQVPDVDAVVTWHRQDRSGSVLLVNRSATEPAEVTIDVDLGEPWSVREAHLLHDPDPYVTNSEARPDRVGLQGLATERSGQVVTLTLPPVSWAALGLAGAP